MKEKDFKELLDSVKQAKLIWKKINPIADRFQALLRSKGIEAVLTISWRNDKPIFRLIILLIPKGVQVPLEFEGIPIEIRTNGGSNGKRR